MKSSKKLRPVVKAAQQQEHAAARHLGNSMRQLEQQQKQLDDLITYRSQYEDYYLAATKTGLSVVQMKDCQIFLSRLDNAITQQRQVVMGSCQDRDLSQVNWQGAHGHSEMINKVVEKRQNDEKQELDKREQNESDDSTLSSLLSRAEYNK